MYRIIQMMANESNCLCSLVKIMPGGNEPVLPVVRIFFVFILNPHTFLS